MQTAAIDIPSATYRLQLSGHLTFDEVRRLVGYFARLGIGALYFSPFFRARAGSTHGYDVVDPTQIDPSLGTEEQFGQLAEVLRGAGLGLMIDIVPNHMGVDDPNNRWWQDVLANGPGSAFAKYFDIDWNPPKEALRGKVLLPVLGDQFGKVLEERQLQLAYEDERFVLRYFERSFPTDPRTWVAILGRVVDFVSKRLDADVPERMELESIVTAVEHLPPRTAEGAEALQQRAREIEVTRRRLATLVESSSDVRLGVEQAIADFNGQAGDPASFDPLEALVTDQPYRLCHWRVATDEINYRRFFDVDSLAAIRVEEPEVFQAVHEATLRLIERGWVTALRIDHADGLHDPARYLTNLADSVGRAKAASAAQPAGSDQGRLYTIVEKILGSDESLPADWPVQGTTGYEFLNLLNGLFVDRLGGYALRDKYVRFSGNSTPFADVLHDSKRTILASSLSAELYTLSNALDRISEQHRLSRDFTRLSLFRALREVLACFPVYRTYIRPEEGTVREEDRRRILDAVRVAKRRNPAMSPSFFDFIGSVLLLQNPPGLSDESVAERRRFVYKFQQFTGPVIAKGLEDTAFYRYFPLASLNEVGSDPMIIGTSVEQFHRRTVERSTDWPHSLLATGTHDTKRGEDVRARLNVLSEVPDEWDAAIKRWQEMNANKRKELDGEPAPDANEEYLIYQILVGTWPVAPPDGEGRRQYVERIVRYLDKALKESKRHTSWLNPNEEYDEAVASFIRTILGTFDSPFTADLNTFVASIANAGFVNSLAQTLVKICTPGVPDFYQGVEFWDFHLVDPDNRQPVDFAARCQALEGLESRAEEDLPGLAAELLAHWPDERLKLLVIWRALGFRKRYRQLFEGSYLPLVAEGPRKGNIVALARTTPNQWALCVVPRLAAQAWRERKAPADGRQGEAGWPIAEWWHETVLQLPLDAPRRWRHVISGESMETSRSADSGQTIDLSQVFHSFPVALLVGQT
ncbi:MAG TPA: malto-oligosyltrehalose synthase [Pirellulales bacterium]|nr:malto-oligosyltrehalose synthase [Pirellulales bacterium]